jgi:hypothetical protein
MANPIIRINDGSGVIDREMTADEFSQHEALRIAHEARKAEEDAAKVAKETTKKDATVKVLTKLGITEDEFKLLFSKE